MNPEQDQNNLTSQPSNSGNQPIGYSPQPPTQPVSPGQLSPTPAKNSNRTIIIALIILVLITVLGIVAYLTLRPKNQDNNQTTNQAINNLTEGLDTNQTNTELKTTTFTSQGKDTLSPVTVTVEHPHDWRVERGDDEVHGGTTVSGDLKIISSAGNVLYLTDRSMGGAGGWCDGDVGLVLTKRINTKNPEYAFYQYGASPNSSVNSFSNINELLFVAYIEPSLLGAADSESIKRYNSLQEGEQFVGHCSIVDRPSMIESRADQPGQGRIYPSLLNKDMQNLSYDSIKDDTDFIAMLGSIEVVE